jgi:hypothetical protein
MLVLYLELVVISWPTVPPRGDPAFYPDRLVR